ncbi:MAG: hypothetical protein WC451_05100 [Patescibacteria group bacterium]
MIEFLLNRWVVLIVGILFMFIGLKPEWTVWVVRTVGKMGWAEQRVGTGSTFDIWKIIGILAPIIAIIYFFSGGIKFEGKMEQPETQWGEYR